MKLHTRSAFSAPRPRCGFAVGALSALGLLLVSGAASSATLTGEAEAAFDVDNEWKTGLDDPTDIAILPDGRKLITQRGGDIVTILPDGTEVEDAIDNVDAGQDEQGLLGVVAHSDFATNKYLYFYASLQGGAANRHKVLRYTLDEQSKLGDLTIIVAEGLMGPANHNGGTVDFYDGALFVSVGDTGGNSSPPSNKFSSCLNVTAGKILRVNPDDGTALANNPLMDVDMATGCSDRTGNFQMMAPDKRVYAWGFRNPFRFWVDPQTGLLWIGDVGEGQREEISVGKDGHYGYPFIEGTRNWQPDQNFTPANCMAMTPAKPCTAPVYDYATAPNGAVIAGRILDGCEWPEVWQKRYIFGDHNKGKVWTLDVNDDRTGVVDDSVKDFANVNGLSAIRLGSDNALYIVEYREGRVARVTAKDAPETCDLPGVGGMGGGGNAGSGNAGANNGGGSNAGSGNNSAGSSNNSGGSSNNGGGPSGNNGGSPTSGNNADAGDDGGCGCRAAGSAGSTPFGMASALSALALLASRRRRPARS